MEICGCSTCGTSKRITGTPLAGAGLLSAVVGFQGYTYSEKGLRTGLIASITMEGLGARLWCTSGLHQWLSQHSV